MVPWTKVTPATIRFRLNKGNSARHTGPLHPIHGIPKMSAATNVHADGIVRRAQDIHAKLLTMQIVAPGADADFTSKLAAENGWSPARSERAYDEYLRFLALASTAPTMAVPSNDVDRVWHLHLLHTRHYWQVLCRTILETDLHHEPSSDSPEDAAQHRKAYLETLTRYEATFDRKPPADIWPQPCTSTAAPLCNPARRSAILALNPIGPVLVICLILAIGLASEGLAALAAGVVVSAAALAAVTLFVSRLEQSPTDIGSRRKDGGRSCGTTGCSSADSSGNDHGSHGHGCSGSHACGSSCGSSCSGGCGGGGD